MRQYNIEIRSDARVVISGAMSPGNRLTWFKGCSLKMGFPHLS